MTKRIEIKGDAIGSAIGDGARVRARDITVYKRAVDQSTLEDRVKDILKRAREALEAEELAAEDKDDAIDDFGKLSSELEKGEPNQNRIARCFDRIRELAPSVASILSSISSLAQLYNGNPPTE